MIVGGQAQLPEVQADRQWYEKGRDSPTWPAAAGITPSQLAARLRQLEDDDIVMSPPGPEALKGEPAMTLSATSTLYTAGHPDSIEAVSCAGGLEAWAEERS
jgi:hypothetical protein